MGPRPKILLDDSAASFVVVGMESRSSALPSAATAKVEPHSSRGGGAGGVSADAEVTTGLTPEPADFEEFVSSRGRELFGLAVLLAGSVDRGGDLYQDTLERLYRRWRLNLSSPMGYARQIMVNRNLDSGRRRRLFQFLPSSQVDSIDTTAADSTIDHEYLLRMLRRLPPRQRASIVLHYWLDLTDKESAELLGCRESTVASNRSIAIAKLRKECDVEF